jgi:hypothetical protein
MTTKRISAAKNVCIALASLTAAAALAYAMAFVVFPPLKPRPGYRDPGGHGTIVDPAPPQDVSSIWTRNLGDVTPPVRIPHFEGSLAGTTVSPDPARSTAVVNTPTGQSLVRVGDLLQSARLDAIAAGSATFDFLGKPFPIKITRFEK